MARRGRRFGLILAAAGAVVAGQLVALAINELSSQQRWPGPLDAMRRQPFGWALALTGVLIVLAAVGVRLQEGSRRGRRVPGRAPQEWVVARPAELQ